MKFLSISKPKQNYQIPSNYLQLLKDAKEWIKNKKADGTIDVIYSLLGKGGISILNYDSAEKGWEDIIAYPLSFMLDYEFTPIVDVDFTLDKVISMLEN